SWQSSAPLSERARPQVLVLGGSTVWGYFVCNNGTVPSLLARALARDGIGGYQVTNFGQPGYVSTQEVVALLSELHEGRIPDLVIFLDGINDTFSAYQNGRAGLDQSDKMLAFRWEHPYKAEAIELVSGLPICRVLHCSNRRVAGVPVPSPDRNLPE